MRGETHYWSQKGRRTGFGPSPDAGELKNGRSRLAIVRPGPIIVDPAEVRIGEKVTDAALTVLARFLPKRFKGKLAEDIARTLLFAAPNGVPGQR